MKGSASHELEVALPAAEVWKVYSTLRLAELASKLLPNVIAKVEVLEGDGGVGTVVQITFPPGSPGPAYQKEKFVRIDEEKRTKDVEVFEGGYLLLGFTSIMVRLQIVEKSSDSSVIKSVLEYEISDELAGNVSFVTMAPFEAIAQAIAKHLIDNNNGVTSS